MSKKEPTKKEKVATVRLTAGELHTIREALDSHLYWQLSEDRERNDGYVNYPAPGSEEYMEGDADDQSRWDEMRDVEKLIERLDGQETVKKPVKKSKKSA